MVPIFASSTGIAQSRDRHPPFQDAAFSVLRSLCYADLDAHVDDLDDKLSDFFVKNGRLSELLTDHYGERMLVSDGRDPSLSARFQKYVDACKRNTRWERAAPHLLALVFASGDKASEEKIQNYLGEMSFLNDSDKDWLLVFFRSYAEQDTEPAKTFRQQRQREIFSAFTSKYLGEIEKICAPAAANADGADSA